SGSFQRIASGTSQLPPKAQRDWPDKIEILGGIRSICIRSKLRVGCLIQQRLRPPEKFGRTAQTLQNRFHPKHGTVNRKDPKQPFETRRKARGMDLVLLS